MLFSLAKSANDLQGVGFAPTGTKTLHKREGQHFKVKRGAVLWGAAITIEEEMLYVAPPRSSLYHMEGQNESYKRLQIACFHIFNRVFNRSGLKRFRASFAAHGVENVSGEALDISASNFAITVVAVAEH